MRRREFLRSSFGAVAAAAIAGAPQPVLSLSQRLASKTWIDDPIRRILYVYSPAEPGAMRSLVETIGGSGFNILVFSFLQAHLSGRKLTLLLNGTEFSALAPRVLPLFARLRTGFEARKRVMLSIGGWNQPSTFEAIRNFGVSAFVRQLTEQAIQPLGIDGIDLDLEPRQGGLDQWMRVHDTYGKTLVDLTNEYKRVHPAHLVTHAPISSIAAELYAKPTRIPGVSGGLLTATRTGKGNNIDWLNVQFYEGGLVEGGDIAGFYRDSLAAPSISMRKQTGIVHPLRFFTPLFEPAAKQPLEFCSRTIDSIDRRCADLRVGKLSGVALWDYRQVAPSIREWSKGLKAALHAEQMK